MRVLQEQKLVTPPYLRPVGNKEVDTLRRFSDGFKLTLCVVVDFIYGMTIACNQRLA